MKSIMVYMGAYIVDPSKINSLISDYKTTYINDPKADYIVYMNLSTCQISSINKKDYSNFKKENKGNIIINIPIIGGDFALYLENFTKIKSWFINQLVHYNREDAVEELMKKYGKYIEFDKSEEIDKFKKIRDNVRNLEQQISLISEEEKRLYKELDEIRKNCDHKVIVKTNNVYVDEDGNSFPDEGCCLFCNNWYADYGFENYIEEIQNSCIIDFTGEQFNDLTEEEKIEKAFTMFKEEREKSPESSDSEIVKTINDSLGYNEEDITNKVLSNKPDLKN